MSYAIRNLGYWRMLKLGIYVNKNLRMDNIQVCGFDYDYTLAHYSTNLQTLIYDLAKEHMVNEVSFFSTDFYFTLLLFFFIGWISLSFSFWWLLQLRYPQCCLEFKYDPTFPIRGLYYDKLKGCLLKLDFFGSIEPDGCYFGRRKVLGIIILFIWMFYALTENDPWNGICLEIGVCLLCLWTW